MQACHSFAHLLTLCKKGKTFAIRVGLVKKLSNILESTFWKRGYFLVDRYSESTALLSWVLRSVLPVTTDGATCTVL